MNTPEASISFRELFAYTDYLANRWMNYFKQNPSALDISVGGKAGTVRELVNHIFMVEQVFASRLFQNEPLAKLVSPSLDDLIRLHKTSHFPVS